MDLYEQKIHIIKEFTEYDIMINKSFRDLLCWQNIHLCTKFSPPARPLILAAIPQITTAL